MNTYLLQILMAALGSLGFGILLGMQPRRLPWAFLGGALTWAVYLGVLRLNGTLFITNLAAAVFANAYAESMACIRKAPATIFRITALVPLIPGSALYYTMSAVVAGNEEAAIVYAAQTGIVAGAIAFGSLVVSAVQAAIHTGKNRITK